MNAKRKKVEDYIIQHMNNMDRSKANGKRYREMFDSMSDAQFHEWMLSIKDKKNVLAVYVPATKVHVTMEDLLAEAKRLGIELFTNFKMWDEATQSYFITPNKYIMLELPIRRMSQFLDHKLSVAEGDSHIDLLTGQVSREDKAGSITKVEVQALYARGLTEVIRELVKFRGGDVVAFSQYKQSLEETGKANMEGGDNSFVRSAVSLDVLFSGMHLETNITGL
jgi:hypothetical protein